MRKLTWTRVEQFTDENDGLFDAEERKEMAAHLPRFEVSRKFHVAYKGTQYPRIVITIGSNGQLEEKHDGLQFDMHINHKQDKSSWWTAGKIPIELMPHIKEMLVEFEKAIADTRAPESPSPALG